MASSFQSHALRLAAVVVVAAAVSPLSAALWQSSNWAVVGTASGAIGYDSNLTASSDGEGDGFLLLDPTFTLKRHGASTRLDLVASAALTRFFAGRSETQTDGGLAAVYSYPFGVDELPRLTSGASWRRSTSANASLGRRVTSNVFRANLAGRVYSTGKLGVVADASYDQTDYRGNDLNRNDRASLTVGLAYQPQPRVEFSLNSLSALGHSSTRSADEDVESREQGLTVQAKGSVLPKVNAAAYAGVSSVRYRGAFRRSDVLPISGGEITWDATARGTVRLALDFGGDFSPEGESMKVRRVTLGYHQRLYDEWTWDVRVTPSRTSYHRQRRTGRDEALGLGLGFAYEPSRRFSAGISYDFTHQSSDRSFARYDRHAVLFKTSFRF